MKTTLVIAALIITAAIAFAAMRCSFCQGTGWKGNYKCTFCKGSGEMK